MRFASLSLLLAGLALSARPCLAADFTADAKSWYDQHAEAFEQAANLSADGYPADGNQVLLALAENDPSPEAAYMIANTLYASDPATSYRLHLRALEALPNEPAVTLEAALEHHRRGEYARAILNYRRALASGKATRFSALLADCLLRTGQLKEAVQAWNDSDHAHQANEIDLAICDVYGPLSPVQRRGELVAKVEAGDLDKFNDLILLDLSFDTDWWTAKIYTDGLDRDLQRAAEALGRRDARFRALAVYAKLARAAEKKSSDIQKTLTDAGLVIGAGAELPENSKLARVMCELAVSAKLVTPAELWTKYEATLRSRLEKQDRDALHLLCWLAAANRNPVLTELDELGFEEWNDPVFASSFMVDRFREKKLTSPTDSQLLAALAIAPDNAILNNLRIALAGDDVTNDMIIAAIKAEYHKLSAGDTKRDSTRLDLLFTELGKRL